ncbi:Circumsporozoite protein [Diplonema papillatum]|nr:Circumsporozoite protein [Diplonema papillatum]
MSSRQLFAVAVTCLAFVSVSARGKGTYVRLDVDTNENVAHPVAVGDCLLLTYELAGSKAIEMNGIAMDFNGTWVAMEEAKKVGSELSCQYDASDCKNCDTLNDVQTMGTVCRTTRHRLFYEVHNPGPTAGTFLYLDFTHTNSVYKDIDGFECTRPGAANDNKCGAAELPDCFMPANGTGGYATGSLDARVGKPCECVCFGEWHGDGCKVPPSCDTLDLTPAATTCGGAACDNVAAEYTAGVLYKDDAFGKTLYTEIASPVTEPDFASAMISGAVTRASPCPAGYSINPSVAYVCPVTNGPALLSGQLCVKTDTDCVQTPDSCPTEQTCSDPDESVNSKFTCTCNPPFVGEAADAAATCAEGSDCDALACGVDQLCTDADATYNGAFACACPVGTATAVNRPAACGSPSTGPPPGTPVTDAPATVPVTDSPATVPVTDAPATVPVTDSPATVPVTDSPATVPVTDSPATVPVTDAPASVPATDTPVPATGVPATGAPASSAPSTWVPAPTDDCGPAACGTGQTCGDPDGTLDSVFVCTCNPPLLGAAATSRPAACTDPAYVPPTSPPAAPQKEAAGESDDDALVKGLIIGFSVAVMCCLWLLVALYLWKRRQAKPQEEVDYAALLRQNKPPTPHFEPLELAPVVEKEPAPLPPIESPRIERAPQSHGFVHGSVIIEKSGARMPDMERRQSSSHSTVPSEDAVSEAPTYGTRKFSAPYTSPTAFPVAGYNAHPGMTIGSTKAASPVASPRLNASTTVHGPSFSGPSSPLRRDSAQNSVRSPSVCGPSSPIRRDSSGMPHSAFLSPSVSGSPLMNPGEGFPTASYNGSSPSLGGTRNAASPPNRRPSHNNTTVLGPASPMLPPRRDSRRPSVLS